MDHQDFTNVTWNKQPVVSTSSNKRKRDQIESDDPNPPVSINHSMRLLIQRARMSKKLSQKELAKKLNMPERTINAYESGSIIPEKHEIRAMCIFLNIKIPK